MFIQFAFQFFNSQCGVDGKLFLKFAKENYVVCCFGALRRNLNLYTLKKQIRAQLFKINETAS